MKKIISYLLIFIFPVSVADAQMEDDTTTKIRKNETGFSFIPAVVVALGGSTAYESNFAVTFRHFMNEKNAFRLKPSVSYFDEHARDISEVIELTDSTRVTEYKTTNISASPSVNFGHEYHWGKKKIKWFAGCDVFYNFRKQEYNIFTIYATKDTTSLASGIIYYSTDSIKSSKISESNRHSIGIAPFIGFRVIINEHWAISANTSFNSGPGFTNQNIYDDNVFLRKEEWTEFNFEMIGLISDLSVIFRF